MMNLKEITAEFNKEREKPVDVRVDHNEYTFTMSDKDIGGVSIIPNYSNCGIFDVHGLWGLHKKDMDLILEFVTFFVERGGRRNIITYNTASNQALLKKSLKKAGFDTSKKTYRNGNSGHRIEFHTLEL